MSNPDKFKIVYINLEKDTDRNQAMRQLCGYLDFPFERFNAFKNSFRNSYPWDMIDINFKDPRNGRNMTYGELSCAMSHLNVWSMVAAGDETVLVFEDDVVAKYDKDKMREEILHIYDILSTTDYEFCYLGRQPLQDNKESKIEVFDRLIEPRYSWLLHAYMITPEGARKLANNQYCNSIVPTDEWVPYMINRGCDLQLTRKFGEPKEPLKALAHVDPNLFWQSQTYSNTEASEQIFLNDIDPGQQKYLLATIATDQNNYGFQLELSSINRNGWEFAWNIVENDEWVGGDVENSPGGGQKINILKRYLDETKDLDDNAIMLFVDGYDVGVLTNPYNLIRRWLENFDDEKVLFAAEKTCWPDDTFADSFPNEEKYPFLNSGCFVGRIKTIRKMVEPRIADADDDQKYYQKRYAETDLIELDHECKIFQCLAGAVDDIEYEPYNGEIFNKETGYAPLVIHGNGNTKEVWSTVMQMINNLYDNCYSYRRWVNG